MKESILVNKSVDHKCSSHRSHFLNTINTSAQTTHEECSENIDVFIMALNTWLFQTGNKTWKVVLLWAGRHAYIQ
jgi:hypothetical protein